MMDDPLTDLTEAVAQLCTGIADQYGDSPDPDEQLEGQTLTAGVLAALGTYQRYTAEIFGRIDFWDLVRNGEAMVRAHAMAAGTDVETL